MAPKPASTFMAAPVNWAGPDVVALAMLAGVEAKVVALEDAAAGKVATGTLATGTLATGMLATGMLATGEEASGVIW